MADNEDNNQEDNSMPLYDRLSEINQPKTDVKELDVIIPDDGENIGGSLTSRMKMSPKRSDFQIADERLFPILNKELEWLSNLMVARVFPETLIPLKNIIVKHLLGEYPDMPLAEAVCVSEVAVTVALDSEGRIDIVRMFGKASETEEEKDKGKLA